MTYAIDLLAALGDFPAWVRACSQKPTHPLIQLLVSHPVQSLLVTTRTGSGCTCTRSDLRSVPFHSQYGVRLCRCLKGADGSGTTHFL